MTVSIFHLSYHKNTFFWMIHPQMQFYYDMSIDTSFHILFFCNCFLFIRAIYYIFHEENRFRQFLIFLQMRTPSFRPHIRIQRKISCRKMCLYRRSIFIKRPFSLNIVSTPTQKGYLCNSSIRSNKLRPHIIHII